MPGKYLLVYDDDPEDVEKKIEETIKAREELVGHKLNAAERKAVATRVKRKLKEGTW